MKLSEDQIRLIEKRLVNALNEEETKSFVKLINENTEFSKEYEEQKQYYKVQEYLSQINDTESKLEETGFFSKFESSKAPSIQKIQKRRFKNFLSYAAGIAILLGLFFLLTEKKNYSESELAQIKKFTPEFNSSIRGVNSEKNEQFIEVNEIKNLDKLKSVLLDLVDQNPKNKSHIINLAIIYNNSGDYKKAIISAKKIIALDNADEVQYTPNQHFAEWIILKSLIGQNKLDKDFYGLLKKIKDNKNHIFHRDALQLEKTINSFWRKF